MTSPSNRQGAEDIIKNIGKRIREVWQNAENPQELSRIGDELVVLNFALGMWLVDFDNEERTTKTDYELGLLAKQDSYIESGQTVSRSEIKAKLETANAKRLYNQIVSAVSKVKICRQDTAKALEMLRTRISLIKENLKEGTNG